jgi:hypothetical protein
MKRSHCVMLLVMGSAADLSGEPATAAAGLPIFSSVADCEKAEGFNPKLCGSGPFVFATVGECLDSGLRDIQDCLRLIEGGRPVAGPSQQVYPNRASCEAELGSEGCRIQRRGPIRRFVPITVATPQGNLSGAGSGQPGPSQRAARPATTSGGFGQSGRLYGNGSGG